MEILVSSKDNYIWYINNIFDDLAIAFLRNRGVIEEVRGL